MTMLTAPYQQAAGFGAEQLLVIESRVQTGILQATLGSTDSVQQLRNDEAIGLGIPTPIPTA